MQKLAARLCALFVVLVVSACSVFGGPAAEEPAFDVVVADPPFEIREYGPIAVAETTADGNYRDAVREGFGRLFNYISGANTDTAEIAMTAPVLTESAPEPGQEIAMTAPVLTEAAGSDGYVISFVLPETMTAGTAPLPTDARVRIKEIPAQRVAVARFSGRLSAEGIAKARADLSGWLETRGQPHSGDWRAAGYNPPWTLPFLRRNEIMVSLPTAAEVQN